MFQKKSYQFFRPSIGILINFTDFSSVKIDSDFACSIVKVYQHARADVSFNVQKYHDVEIVGDYFPEEHMIATRYSGNHKRYIEFSSIQTFRIEFHPQVQFSRQLMI